MLLTKSEEEGKAMKHTPGPWRVTHDGYIAGQGYVPIRTPFRKDAFDTGPGRSDHPEDVLQANARLIAAAPELLVVVKEVINDMGAEDAPWYDAARAAIAKAENES